MNDLKITKEQFASVAIEQMEKENNRQKNKITFPCVMNTAHLYQSEDMELTINDYSDILKELTNKGVCKIKDLMDLFKNEYMNNYHTNYKDAYVKNKTILVGATHISIWNED